MTRHNDRDPHKQLSITHIFAAAAHQRDPEYSTISPKVALGQLIGLDPFARKFFGQLVVASWADQIPMQPIGPETAQALGSVLDIRTFDTQHLALSAPAPFALLECSIDTLRGVDEEHQVTIRPSARGLALVRALLTGEDVTY